MYFILATMLLRLLVTRPLRCCMKKRTNVQNN
uniref:Uncharacterized protein n=1 Tax=Siphoviridae sp. ct6d71 TaxID=2826298 RepID=A0A8S5R2X9_9CAUD|nr:MAG TPA: hypothetical protein [Siphoviridae sp. ct6d71]